MPRAFAQKPDFLLAPPGLFRLLLAAAVIVSHTTRLDVGRLGVLFFFYLSGYWTSLIWKQKFNHSATGHFYAARYLRIAPLYLLTVVATAMILARPLHLENFTLLGVASTARDPTGVSWSLDIELQFYLLVPLIAGLLASNSIWIILPVTLLIGAVGCWMAEQWHLVLVAKYLPAFVLGALTDAKSWKPTSTQANWSIVAFVAMTAVTALTPFLDKNRPNPFDEDIWSFFWMIPLLPYVARSLTVKSSKLDRHLGNLSYPLYLVHLPLIWFVRAHWGESVPIKLFSVAVSCVLALALYAWFDRPVDTLRVRLTEKPIRARQPVSA
jgi:peptidoglycan/LPS O-acetylase OafA/YrhL